MVLRRHYNRWYRRLAGGFFLFAFFILLSIALQIIEKVGDFFSHLGIYAGKFSIAGIFAIGIIGLCVFLAVVYLIRRVSRRPKEKWLNKNGYYVLNNGELEHRYFARLALNRSLKKNEVVHHINGCKTDNSLSNLCVMDWEEHECFHGWLYWKKKVSGHYPSRKMQRKRLREKYNGIILE